MSGLSERHLRESPGRIRIHFPLRFPTNWNLQDDYVYCEYYSIYHKKNIHPPRNWFSVKQLCHFFSQNSRREGKSWPCFQIELKKMEISLSSSWIISDRLDNECLVNYEGKLLVVDWRDTMEQLRLARHKGRDKER